MWYWSLLVMAKFGLLRTFASFDQQILGSFRCWWSWISIWWRRWCQVAGCSARRWGEGGRSEYCFISFVNNQKKPPIFHCYHKYFLHVINPVPACLLADSDSAKQLCTAPSMTTTFFCCKCEHKKLWSTTTTLFANMITKNRILEWKLVNVKKIISDKIFISYENKRQVMKTCLRDQSWMLVAAQRVFCSPWVADKVRRHQNRDVELVRL